MTLYYLSAPEGALKCVRLFVKYLEVFGLKECRFMLKEKGDTSNYDQTVFVTYIHILQIFKNS